MEYNHQFLQEIIEQHNFDYRSFAKFVGISRSMLSVIARGAYEPKKMSPVFEKIVEALKRLGVSNPGGFLTPGKEIINEIEEEITIMSTDVMKHFSFKFDPFETGIPDAVWYNQENQNCFELVIDAAKRGKFLLVIGAVGTGKSTLFSQSWKALRKETQLKLSNIPSLNVKRADDRWVTNYIIGKIGGITEIPSGFEARWDLLNDVLENLSKDEITPVMFFDEGHQLPEQTLRDLRIFWEERKKVGVSISFIIFAQPLIRGLLSKPSLQEVTKRLDILDLKSFDKTNNLAEITSYIEFKLKQAGVGNNLFSEEAIQKISQYCRNPLEVNMIARKALINAYQIGKPEVSVGCVEQALKRN